MEIELTPTEVRLIAEELLAAAIRDHKNCKTESAQALMEARQKILLSQKNLDSKLTV